MSSHTPSPAPTPSSRSPPLLLRLILRTRAQVATPAQTRRIVDRIDRHKSNLQREPFGKHILARVQQVRAQIG